jgi:hypothetical protein
LQSDFPKLQRFAFFTAQTHIPPVPARRDKSSPPCGAQFEMSGDEVCVQMAQKNVAYLHSVFRHRFQVR